MSITARSLPLPTLTSLAAPSAEEGLRLAAELSGEMMQTWERSQALIQDPAALLRNPDHTRLDPEVLFTVQYSLIAAANNYWRE